MACVYGVSSPSDCFRGHPGVWIPVVSNTPHCPLKIFLVRRELPCGMFVFRVWTSLNKSCLKYEGSWNHLLDVTHHSHKTTVDIGRVLAWHGSYFYTIGNLHTCCLQHCVRDLHAEFRNHAHSHTYLNNQHVWGLPRKKKVCHYFHTKRGSDPSVLNLNVRILEECTQIYTELPYELQWSWCFCGIQFIRFHLRGLQVYGVPFQIYYLLFKIETRREWNSQKQQCKSFRKRNMKGEKESKLLNWKDISVDIS